MSDIDDIGAAVLRVDLLIERGRYAAARSETARALAHEPANNRLLCLRAQIELLDGHLDVAESAASDLLTVEPRSCPGRLILFHVYEDTNRLAQAEEIIISVIRDYPESPAGYTNYSRLMLRTHNFSKAGALAREALKLEPEGYSAQLSLALCNLVEGGVDPDVDLASLVDTHPGSVSVIAMLAASLAEAHRTKEAQALAEELVRADPGNESFIDLVVDLRVANHWAMKPLWPVQRYGWTASAVIWVAAVVGLNLLQDSPYAPLANVLAPLLLGFIVYSWVAPPLLTRWLKR